MEWLAFTKMQGVGNDFVVVDGRGQERDWSHLAVRLCDRNFGVGADGLLVIDMADDADIAMQMFNPDGTPDVCGNGLRCVARYAMECGIVSGPEMRILTLAGVRRAYVLPGGNMVQVGMGEPHFVPAEIPMRVSSPVERVVDYPLTLLSGETLNVTALSTGSTHTVLFVPELPGDKRFLAVSPQVEHHALFPERASLMWCAVEGPSRLRLRIWERGAGETWGCGTGACAAAVAAVLHGYAHDGEPVTVASKGGELVIRWSPGGAIEMTGPAEFVFEGVHPL